MVRLPGAIFYAEIMADLPCEYLFRLWPFRLTYLDIIIKLDTVNYSIQPKIQWIQE